MVNFPYSQSWHPSLTHLLFHLHRIYFWSFSSGLGFGTCSFNRAEGRTVEFTSCQNYLDQSKQLECFQPSEAWTPSLEGNSVSPHPSRSSASTTQPSCYTYTQGSSLILFKASWLGGYSKFFHGSWQSRPQRNRYQVINPAHSSSLQFPIHRNEIKRRWLDRREAGTWGFQHSRHYYWLPAEDWFGERAITHQLQIPAALTFSQWF